ncbi:hypothetical protein H0H93_011005, partial [Arthromyces matolae]
MDASQRFLKPLNSLPKMLAKSQALLTKYFASESSTDSNSLTFTPPSDCDPSILLYSSIRASVEKENVNAIIFNLETAAFHLNHLLKGNVALPTKVDDLERVVLERLTPSLKNLDGSSSESFGEQAIRKRNQEVMAELKRRFKASRRSRLTALHNSLFLALGVSPLLLLVARRYEKLPKDLVLSAWSRVGGLERPPVVVKMENAIWDVVFNAALSGDVRKHIQEALPVLNECMPAAAVKWITFTSEDSEVRPLASHQDESDSDEEFDDGKTLQVIQ